MKVLEVVGALVAKTRVPGFDSPATTNFFFPLFSFAFPQTPVSEKVSIQFL